MNRCNVKHHIYSTAYYVYFNDMDAILIKTCSKWFDLSTAGGTAPFYASKKGFFCLKTPLYLLGTKIFMVRSPVRISKSPQPYKGRTNVAKVCSCSGFKRQEDFFLCMSQLVLSALTKLKNIEVFVNLFEELLGEKCKISRITNTT